MPLQIPQSQGPSVNPQVSPRVRPPSVGPDPGGGRAAERAYGQARGLADDASGLVVREEMKAQEAQYNELASRAEQKALERQQALAKVQGKGALMASQEALRDYDKDLQDLQKEASSGLVRDRLAAHGERSRMGLQRFADPYARSEMEKYAQAQYVALKENNFNAAVTSGDPLVIATKMDETHQAIRRNGALNGLPPETIKAELDRESSAIHAGVIQQFLTQNQGRKARDYFAANKDDMTAVDLARMTPRLKIDDLNNEALALADQIMSSGERVAVDFENGKFLKGPVSFEDAIEKTKDIEDLELRKQTQHELTRINSINKEAERQGYQDNVEAAYTAVEKMEKVPVEVLARLNTTDRQRIKILESRQDRESNRDLLYGFNEQSPEEMAAMQPDDLLALRVELSKKDFEEVENAVLKAKRDSAKPDTKTPKLDYTELRFRMEESGLGIDTLSATEKKDKSITSFEDAKKQARSAAFVEFRNTLASSEKSLSIPEQQKLFDEIVKRKAGHLLQTFKVDDDYFDFDDRVKRAGELEAGDFESDDWETPAEVTKKIDGITKVSVPSWSSLPSTVKTARTNMAHVAQAQGQSDEFIAEILNGTRHWPW
jgi:hypothetical protein